VVGPSQWYICRGSRRDGGPTGVVVLVKLVMAGGIIFDDCTSRDSRGFMVPRGGAPCMLSSVCGGDKRRKSMHGCLVMKRLYGHLRNCTRLQRSKDDS
jgi:hypothetical protein